MTITGHDVSNTNPNTNRDDHPVFRGLEDSRVSGKDIAEIIGVSPPTYSKWRSGRVRVPAPKLVLLTLLLANWIDEMEAELELRSQICRDPQSEIGIKVLRRCVALQDEANKTLTQDEVREGSRLFRKWWRGQVAANPALAKRQAVA